MSALGWYFNAFLVGIVAFWVGPVLLGNAVRGKHVHEIGGRFIEPRVVDINLDKYIEAIADVYFGFAMKMYHRAILVERSHGGYSLIPTTFDAESKSEKGTLGGQRKDWEDPNGHMTRFYNRPFGVAHEDSDVILRPSLAEIGEELYNLSQDGLDEMQIRSGESVTDLVVGAIPISKRQRLVSLKTGIHALLCSADPDTVDTTITYTEKSQNPFSRNQAMKYATALMLAFLTGFGSVWFGAKEISGSGGNLIGDTISMTLLGGVV